jgi:hypothetical protein
MITHSLSPAKVVHESATKATDTRDDSVAEQKRDGSQVAESCRKGRHIELPVNT